MVAQVLEDGAGDGERDRDGPDLCDVDEANGRRDVVGGDLGGRDAVAGLEDEADTDGDEDLEPVDRGRVRARRHAVHERAADKHQHGRREVPRRVAANNGQQAAREHDEDDEQHDKGQQPDSGFERRVALGELEEERHVVDAHSHGAGGRRGREVQEHEGAAAGEVDGEEAAFRGGEDRKALLEGVRNRAQAAEDPERDGPARVPAPGRAGEGQHDHEQDEGRGVEDRADPVDLRELASHRRLWLWVVSRKEPDVDWRSN